MEQLSLSAHNTNTVQNIFNTYLLPIFQHIVIENNLDLSLLSFKPGEKSSSYSSILFGSSLLCRIRYSDKQKYLGIPRRFSSLLPEGTPTRTTNSDKDYMRIPLETADELLRYSDCLGRILQEIINAIPKGFDCCSRFQQCSDVFRCIHPNKEIALNCGYRSILANGRVFYGKNRNVD